MAINIRQKGAEGEREIARELNRIIQSVLDYHGLDDPDVPVIQRNQNQTAVGGNDLSNVFGLGIEVKRQENLCVNVWWKQCINAAERNGEFPVLLYRQNRKAWRCVLLTQLMLPPAGSLSAVQYTRAEISWDDFQIWFREWVSRKIAAGEWVKV